MTNRRRHDLSVIALMAGAVGLCVVAAIVLTKLAAVGLPFLIVGVGAYVVVGRLMSFVTR